MASLVTALVASLTAMAAAAAMLASFGNIASLVVTTTMAELATDEAGVGGGGEGQESSSGDGKMHFVLRYVDWNEG